MTVSIEAIEDLIKKYEVELQTTIANHATLAGGMNALKMLLNLATPIVDAVVPGASEAVAIVNAVDTAVNEVVPPVDSSAEIPVG
jgi:hypothetical protein